MRMIGRMLAGALALGVATVAPAAGDNRAMIRDFAHIFYEEKNAERAFLAHVAPDYIQHNPGIADGREAAITALRGMFSPGSPNRFEIKRILVDGDLAAIHLMAVTPAGARTAVVDLYRISDGKIVEHWDVLQPVPATSKNPHPMF